MIPSVPFKLYVEVFPSKQTILEISEKVITVLRILAKQEPAFQKFEILSEKNPGSVDDVFSEEATYFFAEKMLMRHLSDIKKYDKVVNPDVNYCREMGFTFSISFLASNGAEFSWNFRVGGSNHWQVTTLTMEKNYRPGFQWHKNIVEAFLMVLPVQELIVRVNDRSYRDNAELNYRFPLGWINYFSNDFFVKIPDDLPHVTYENKENGKLFYIAKEDFSHSENDYIANINKLSEVMSALKIFSPNYGRDYQK